MSCPEPQYSAYGRRGIGVIQPQSGLDYPFVNPSDDIRYLVADFYLAYDDPGEYDPETPSTVFPLRISHISGVACVADTDSRVDIVVKDATDQIVLDTASVTSANYEAANWSNSGARDYRIYSWKTATAVCRMLVYSSWSPADPDEKTYADSFSPASAVLDARTVYKMPKRLKSLSVRQKAGTLTVGPYSGAITLKNKYNTELTAVGPLTNNFRSNTNITISAASGSGFGYYPRCGTGNAIEDGVPIKTINGIAPTDCGHFFVSCTDCLYTRRATQLNGASLPVPATNPATDGTNDVLRVGADCSQCCTCDDFANTATYMNTVAARYQLIGDRVINSVKANHQQNILLWNDQRLCTINNPLKILMVPQRCPYIDFVLMLCNPCQECLPGSTLTLQLETTPYNELAAAELVRGHTAMYAPGIDGRPVPIETSLLDPDEMWLSIKFPALKLGTSAYVKFRLKFSDRSSYAVQGTVTGMLDAPYSTPIRTGCDNETPEGDRYTASASATQALYCNDAGLTEMPY